MDWLRESFLFTYVTFSCMKFLYVLYIPQLLKDTQLMTLIMALLLIDVIIVTSWASFDPMHRHLNNLTLEKDPTDRSVVYQNQVKMCTIYII